MMSGDDPVPSERALDGSEDGLTVLDAGRVQRHVHTLARVRQRRAAGLFEEPLRVRVAELERLLHSRHLVLGRVSEGEPEQLVVGEALERGSPVLDLLGLSLVEQEHRQHVPLFPETATFPCLANQRSPPHSHGRARLRRARRHPTVTRIHAQCEAGVGARSASLGPTDAKTSEAPSLAQRAWDG
jgi:hypothetical protein